MENASNYPHSLRLDRMEYLVILDTLKNAVELLPSLIRAETDWKPEPEPISDKDRIDFIERWNMLDVDLGTALRILTNAIEREKSYEGDWRDPNLQQFRHLSMGVQQAIASQGEYLDAMNKRLEETIQAFQGMTNVVSYLYDQAEKAEQQ
jgi:hypothetical protein